MSRARIRFWWEMLTADPLPCPGSPILAANGIDPFLFRFFIGWKSAKKTENYKTKSANNIIIFDKILMDGFPKKIIKKSGIMTIRPIHVCIQWWPIEPIMTKYIISCRLKCSLNKIVVELQQPVNLFTFSK